jgi:hypothetical protein
MLKDSNSCEFLPADVDLPGNYDVQIKTTWKSGKDDRPYGLCIGTEASTRLNFSVSGNGWTTVFGHRDNNLIEPDPIPWESDTSNVGNGSTSNIIKVEVRGNQMTFYVNGNMIGTVNSHIPAGQHRIGVFVDSPQKIAFDDLRISAPGGGGGGMGMMPDKVLLTETFDDNSAGWAIWPDGPYYKTKVKRGGYEFDMLKESNSCEFYPGELDLGPNYDVEVNTTWKKGKDDRPYGLCIGSEAATRLNFSVSGNGWTTVFGHRDNNLIEPDPIPWESGTSIVGNGRTSNLIKVEVRGDQMTFYVNGNMIGTVNSHIPAGQHRVGVFVDSPQKIEFDDLKVYAY